MFALGIIAPRLFPTVTLDLSNSKRCVHGFNRIQDFGSCRPYDCPMGRWQRSRRRRQWPLTCAWREPDAALRLDSSVLVRRWAAHCVTGLACGKRGNPLAWATRTCTTRTQGHGARGMCVHVCAWAEQHGQPQRDAGGLTGPST